MNIRYAISILLWFMGLSLYGAALPLMIKSQIAAVSVLGYMSIPVAMLALFEAALKYLVKYK